MNPNQASVALWSRLPAWASSLSNSSTHFCKHHQDWLCFGVFFCVSWQHLRSHQDLHWLVTVRTHGDFIVLLHWETWPVFESPNSQNETQTLNSFSYPDLKGKFVLFNDVSGAHWIWYHRLLDIKHMLIVTYFFRGNPLSPYSLLFPISSKGSFICVFPQTGRYIPQPLMDQLWNTGWNGK